MTIATDLEMSAYHYKHLFDYIFIFYCQSNILLKCYYVNDIFYLTLHFLIY